MDPHYPERALWLGVIYRMLDDILNPDSIRSPRSRETVRQQAISWFKPSNPDFLTACECANVSSDAVMDIARKKIAEARRKCKNRF